MGTMKAKSPSLAAKVAARFVEAMAVVLRNVAGHNWGWFSREDQRMHVQTVDKDSLKGPNHAKVWLETRGTRGFERATGKLSGPEWKKLQEKVETEREVIESRWSVFMVENDWVKADLKGHIVTLTAYPTSNNSFTRRIDLKRLFPGAYPAWDRTPPKLDLKSSPGLLAVGPEDDPDDRDHIELREVLFVG